MEENNVQLSCYYEFISTNYTSPLQKAYKNSCGEMNKYVYICIYITEINK